MGFVPEWRYDRRLTLNEDHCLRMNRRKKIKQILTQKAKKANAKNQHSNKPRYISKAEREKLAQAAESADAETVVESAEV